jgi:hypothetical protein
MSALGDRTHGRWPLAAAAAAGRQVAAGGLAGVVGSVGMMAAMRGRLARRRRRA